MRGINRSAIIRPGLSVGQAAGRGLGQAVGRTNASGMEVEDRPVSSADFMGTICQALGIDHTKENTTPEGRPIRIAAAGA
jgi:hypothetical protein